MFNIVISKLLCSSLGRNDRDRFSARVVGTIARLQWHEHADAVGQYEEEHEKNEQDAPDGDVEEPDAVVVVAELVVADVERLHLHYQQLHNTIIVETTYKLYLKK